MSDINREQLLEFLDVLLEHPLILTAIDNKTLNLPTAGKLVREIKEIILLDKS